VINTARITTSAVSYWLTPNLSAQTLNSIYIMLTMAAIKAELMHSHFLLFIDSGWTPVYYDDDDAKQKCCC